MAANFCNKGEVDTLIAGAGGGGGGYTGTEINNLLALRVPLSELLVGWKQVQLLVVAPLLLFLVG